MTSENYAVVRKVKIDDSHQTVQAEEMKIFR